MTDPFAIALISALVGAGIAGFATWYAARYAFAEQEKATQRRAAEEKQTLIYNVTTLLHQEIDHNRDLLKALWDKVMLNPPPSGGNNQQEFEMRTRFIAEPMPQWGRLMWESQAGYLPTALSSDVIRRVYEEYAQHDSLAGLQSRIADKLPPNLVSEVQHWKIHYPLGSIPPSLPEQQTWYEAYIRFLTETRDSWDRAYGIMNRITSSLNPVTEAAPPVPTPIPAPTSWWSRIVGRR